MKTKDLITICDLLEENLTEFDELQTDDGRWLDVHEALYEISEELRKRRWIPVGERPPETGKEVFVYLWGDVPYLASVNDEGQWETDHFYLDADDAPKAWMQLPEPYKEVEE